MDTITGNPTSSFSDNISLVPLKVPNTAPTIISGCEKPFRFQDVKNLLERVLINEVCNQTKKKLFLEFSLVQSRIKDVIYILKWHEMASTSSSKHLVKLSSVASPQRSSRRFATAQHGCSQRCCCCSSPRLVGCQPLP